MFSLHSNSFFVLSMYSNSFLPLVVFEQLKISFSRI